MGRWFSKKQNGLLSESNGKFKIDVNSTPSWAEDKSAWNNSQISSIY